MAFVASTFAYVASKFASGPLERSVYLNSSSVQLGGVGRGASARAYVSRFNFAAGASKTFSRSTCNANLYHVATSFPLGALGSTWQELGAHLHVDGPGGGIAAGLQSVTRKGVNVRANRGDMLGNNNVRFSPVPGSSSPDSEILLKNHVPLYVMLPLNTVSTTNKLNHVRAVQASLRALKVIGVDGVLMHVWWGSVEGERPQQYDWSAYLALVKMVNAAGLKLQAALCFHGCAGSADGCVSTLPAWVLKIGESNPDIFFTDRSGYRNKECLSLAVDGLALFEGRTPLQMCAELMESFRQTFEIYLGDTMVEVMVGLGPAGELRYPAFPSELWQFPGVGEFQCYDKYMLEDLRKHASLMGKPEWGLRGPTDAGSYNYWPNETGFFNEQNGTWDSPFAKFFLSWYAGALVEHGDRMLSLAGSIFHVRDHQVVLAGKIPGIYWWRKTRSHAAELTAGYYNVDGQDGYDLALRMFAKNGALVTVPCMEMSDDEFLVEMKCSPEAFLLQIRRACAKYGVQISGENSLVRFDETAHSWIKKNIHRWIYPELPRMAAFTFFRMGESMFQPSHWRLFVNFARTLNKDQSADEGERAYLEEESILSYSRPTLKSKQNSEGFLYV